ncbi:PstS family phosphate ABC transporter substrate-binding protein [soil metagenome]
MDKIRVRLGIAAVATMFVVAACAGPAATNAPTDGATQPTGSIRIDGSSTVGPLSEVAAQLYMEQNSRVRVSVAQSGTSGGFQKFCSGETDMNDASREIKDSEIEQCGQAGIGYDAIAVANDALSLLVNNDNPLSCLTVDQARQIWDLDSTVATWGDVEGLDLPAEFAARPVSLFGPGTDSGTFDFFTEVITGEVGRINLGYTDIGEDDHAAVLGVQGEEGAMGYVPYSYYREVLGDVKALDIDDGNGCVAATLENVQDGNYTPLGRPLFVYASDTSLARPEVLDFMKYYIDNAVQIAELAGFVPLTDEQLAEQHAKIEQLVGGGS